MELPTISALEFNQIRESIKNFIRSKTDFQDYDFEGSNLSMLVDILAYNSMYSSYNINMAANELNLDTAVLRDNVVSHAKRLGYTPNSYTSAKVNYNITVNNVSGYQSVNVSTGPLFSTTQNNKVYTFLLRNALNVNTQGSSSVTFQNVELVEGSEFSIRYTVNDANENQRFFVPNNFVDADSIKVFIISDPATNLEVEYQRKLGVVGVTASDRVFFVEEVQDQKYEIIFGDDIIGRKLQNGEIVIIRYIVSSGSVANQIATSQLKFIGTITGDSAVISPTNIAVTALSAKTDGGSEFESIKSIKYRAPRYYASQQRAVVNSDYESILQNIYSNADLIRVIGGETKSPPEFGKVFISIKPKIGSTISIVEKTKIVNELKKYAVGSVTPVIEDAIPFFIDLYIDVIYDQSKTNKDKLTLINLTRQIISDYNLDDEFKNFNGLFSSSKLICLIRDIEPAVKFVVVKPIFKRVAQLFENVRYRYTLDYYTRLKNNIDSKYTLISDPFCVKGYNTPLFLVGFSNNFSGCEKDGTVYLMTEKGRVVAIVGTINYELGLVEFSLTACQTSPINIYVIPDNPDITTGADTYPVVTPIKVDYIDIGSSTGSQTSTVQPLPTPDTLVPPTTPIGDPLGIPPVSNVPGTTTNNPDGSVTVVGDDGTATTTNPDGSQTTEQPTNPVDPCIALYAKIEAQNYVDNDTKQKLAEYGCPPPDPNIEDFTPVTPDICS
jgi:hypothetical protein